MEREDAYKIGWDFHGFVGELEKKGFDYNSSTMSILSSDLKSPNIGILLRGEENYIIINKDSPQDGEAKRKERERLRKLVESL